MPTLFLIVEGEGEREAMPRLVGRVLRERHQITHWALKVRVAGSIGSLRKDLTTLVKDVGCQRPDAILIVCDSERQCEDWPASRLAAMAREAGQKPSVAVVIAHVMSEAWILADPSAIKQHYTLECPPADVEEPDHLNNPKDTLRKLVGRANYRERRDQKELFSKLDLNLVADRSRSFRRLLHAVEELVRAVDAGGRVVTPS